MTVNDVNDFSFFEKVDLFGKNFQFTFGGNSEFKSIIGGSFTLLSILIIIYCAWVLGNEILFRNLPKDYQVMNIYPEPMNVTLNVPFGFMIQDSRGNVIQDYDKHIIFEAYYYNLYRDNGQFRNSVPPQNVVLRKCQSSDFSKEVFESFINMRLQYGFCLSNSSHLKLGGDYNMEFAKFVAVQVRPCFNTTVRTNCAPKEQTFSFLNQKNLVISVKHEKILYNSRNYTYPIKKFISEDNILVDPYIVNYPKYLIEEFTVDTDSGYIGTDTSSSKNYQFGYMINDIITTFDDNGKLPEPQQLLLYEYSFFEASTVRTQIRSYLKVTEMLASLGGIIKVYLLVFSYLFHTIYERIMYEQIITRLFNFGKTNNKTTPVELNSIPTNSPERRLNSKSYSRATRKIVKEYNAKLPLQIISMNKNSSEKYQINKEEISKKMKAQKLAIKRTTIFKFSDHIILSFMPFCQMWSKKIKAKTVMFEKFVKHTHSYTDVLNLIKHFYEFERLKFVLFNDKQLAVFQNISIPDNPFEQNNHYIHKRYSLMKDYEKQKEKCFEFFNKELDKNKNKRLKKLYVE